MRNNVVCLRCGKQFYFAYKEESELAMAECPDCGGTAIGELTQSDLFKNYGFYLGGG